MKLALLSAVILSIVLLQIVSYSDSFRNPELEQQTAEGQICAIDTSYSNIVVKLESFHDEITINVPHKTTIYKGGAVVSLKDLEEGDNVAVDYYNDSPGPLKALKIEVKS